MIIRPATHDDLSSMAAIDERSNPSPWTPVGFAEEMQRAVSRIRVAECEGRVVGFVVYWVVADEAEVLDISVLPEARRCGFGTALVRSAMEDARSRGATTAHLEVRAGNAAARGLYGRLGFSDEGARHGYYADGETAVRMAVSLR